MHSSSQTPRVCTLRLSLDRVNLIPLHISMCTGDGAVATRLAHWIWVSTAIMTFLWVLQVVMHSLVPLLAVSWQQEPDLNDTRLVSVFISTLCSEEECSKCLRKLNTFFYIWCVGLFWFYCCRDAGHGPMRPNFPIHLQILWAGQTLLV